MKKWFAILLVSVSMFGTKHAVPVLYAQVLPSPAHADFTPSVDSPDQYAIFLDGVQVATFLASGCSPTLCHAPFSIPAVGLHSVTVASQTVTISSDPTTLSTGPLTPVATFTLKKGNPAAPTGTTVKQ